MPSRGIDQRRARSWPWQFEKRSCRNLRTTWIHSISKKMTKMGSRYCTVNGTYLVQLVISSTSHQQCTYDSSQFWYSCGGPHCTYCSARHRHCHHHRYALIVNFYKILSYRIVSISSTGRFQHYFNNRKSEFSDPRVHDGPNVLAAGRA